MISLIKGDSIFLLDIEMMIVAKLLLCDYFSFFHFLTLFFSQNLNYVIIR